MTLPLTPELAPWVVPSSLGVLALLLSTYLVLSVRRRRLAEVADLEDVDDLPVQAEDRDVRVLKRQVDVLTRTLAEWDSEQRVPAPRGPEQAYSVDASVRLDPSAPSAAEPPAEAMAPVVEPVEPASPVAPAPAPAGWPAPPTGPSTAYVALSRELAAAGDPAGAVLAQWVADLQVLRPALGAHGAELARAVSGVRHDEPVAALRACREAALGLVRTAGSVRALLAPLDHLADLGDLGGGVGHVGVPTTLPDPLLDMLPADQRERLAASGLAPAGAAPAGPAPSGLVG
ncbi:hypothetical protein [uncultured Nocardioides sp.]|uniref:hypothetical protein n=1 Tax=uncultured Nocardioides sp. TaxID=198441 RepID=UPI0026242E65|nr:hypothetical protein [uncultured Nocardioides sp.]